MKRSPPAIPPALAMLSHEFRTPLNGVLGMARLLETTRLTAEQKAYVEALKTSGDHLLGLVNDVLDLARLEAGKASIDLAPVEIEPLLQSVCELLSPKAHERGIEIAWCAQPDLGPVLADEGRLRQILINFAGNAIKLTQEGGVLVGAALLPGGRLRLFVRDTGPGVEPDQAKAIFEPFTQAPRGVKAGGAGLGLTIVKHLADSLGGVVSLDNPPGGGAEFRFEADFEPAASRPAARPLRGRRVHVSSSNPILRAAVIGQLEACGARPANPDEGAEIQLIDHSGQKRAPRPPAGAPAIILLTAEERERIPAFKAAGWAGYLIKPVRRASLSARILAALEDGEPAAPAPAEDERAAAAAAPGARVLLAEDNPINALLAAALLEREGCHVERVADGAAAVAAVGRQHFDLILMDLRMPGMSGLEAVRALRARGVVTPVAAFTADAFEDDRRAAREAGMNDFLVKPLTPPALRAVLTRWVGWTPQAQEAKLAS